MEVIVVKLQDVLQTLQETDDFIQVMDIRTPVKIGDPGIIMATEYPYMFVHPVGEQQVNSTVGGVGYDVRNLSLRVGICLLAADYFDETVNELPGYMTLIRTASAVREELLRLSNRTLDNTVRNLTVPQIDYLPEQRGADFTTMAYLTLVVQKQYQHKS